MAKFLETWLAGWHGGTEDGSGPQNNYYTSLTAPFGGLFTGWFGSKEKEEEGKEKYDDMPEKVTFEMLLDIASDTNGKRMTDNMEDGKKIMAHIMQKILAKDYKSTKKLIKMLSDKERLLLMQCNAWKNRVTLIEIAALTGIWRRQAR